MKLKKGLVQIYTGNGKGKSTAAFGLALRAAGAGLRVHIIQFIKGLPYSELKTLKKVKNVTIEQCGRGCFIKRRPVKADKKCASRGLCKAQKIIFSKKYDVVVLDEVNIALDLGLISASAIKELIRQKPHNVELVLTGRYCPRTLYNYADLVTEMKEIKHPYRKGIRARRGIEC